MDTAIDSGKQRIQRWIPDAPMRMAPGPQGLPLLGNVRIADESRFSSLLSLRENYGDLARLRFVHLVFHLAFHPDLVQAVLADQNKLFNKNTRGYRVLRGFLGNGLLTSEGSFWLRQRRIAQPAFHRTRIAALAKLMSRIADECVERIAERAKQNQVVNVYAEMMHATQRIAGMTLLSVDPSLNSEKVSHDLDVVLRKANDILLKPWSLPKPFPTPSNRKAAAAQRDLDALVYRIIAERRRGETKDDLLQMLMDSKDEDSGESMSDEQLRDEVMVIFLAGHETTASSLTFSLHLLANHLQVQESVADEARHCARGDLSLEDVQKLELTTRVFKEAMRLYPPAWVIGRSPISDLSIDGNFVPKNSQLLVMPWVTHRHPDFWSDPNSFDPERFTAERTKAMHRYQYFPFAGGPRLCIGQAFAMMEGPLVLAKLLAAFRFEAVKEKPLELDALITLRPKNGLWLKVSKR